VRSVTPDIRTDLQRAINNALSVENELPTIVQASSGKIPTLPDGEVYVMNTDGKVVFYVEDGDTSEYVSVDRHHVIDDIEDYK